MHVAMKVRRPTTVNNTIFPLSVERSPGDAQEKMAEPKTKANKIRQRFIVPCNVVLTSDATPEKFFEDKIGFEVL
jgi:hypothetical protein